MPIASSDVNSGNEPDDGVMIWQKIGLEVVKCEVLFTFMVITLSTAVDFSQLFKTDQTVALSTEIFMLQLYFGSVMVNVVVGTILFLLCTTKGNFHRKVFFLKMAILLTFASAIVEMVVLFAPNAITTAVDLFQVFRTDQNAATSTEIFMLKLFGSAIINVVVGAILLPLFLKMGVLLTFASIIVEIVLLFAPNVTSTMVDVFQVFKIDQVVVAPTEIFMSKLYFGSAIVTVVIGAILFPPSITTKGNFCGRVFLLKVTILLTFASAVVEVACLQ